MVWWIFFHAFHSFWRMLAQVYDPVCLYPIVKYGGGFVVIWAAMPWFSIRPIVTLKVRNSGEKYWEILANQVHPMMQTLFPWNFLGWWCIYPCSRTCSIMVWWKWKWNKTSTLSRTVTRPQYNWIIMVHFRAFNTEYISSTGICPRTFSVSLWSVVKYDLLTLWVITP